MQRIGITLYNNYAFSVFIGRIPATTPLVIATSECEPVTTASSGLSTHYNQQLKIFAQFEALKQNSSPIDYRLWRKLADKFI
ncbi:hypothetical protein ATS75_12160 [Pseudoalteromonas sp. H105]|nr:hypothetical protein ATS75_12160 [Pseudoalteromonas sp. H105]